MRNFAVKYTHHLAKDNPELKNSLRVYSTISIFEDTTWVLDKLKRKGLSNTKNTLYFVDVPVQYLEITKLFALVRLNKRMSSKTVEANIWGLKKFYKFLQEECNERDLINVDKNIIFEYENYLKNDCALSKASKETCWSSINAFFRNMINSNATPAVKVVSKINPFSRIGSDRLFEQKYVPVEVVKQYDDVVFNESLPVYIKLCYWICRLIPSRIGEVISVSIDFCKQYGEYYTLQLNMFKQNGGYIEPEKRLIGFKNEDMGEYLLNLINKQVEISKSLQAYVDRNDRGLLFTYVKSKYFDGKYSEYNLRNTNVFTLSDSNFRKILIKLARRYKITDGNGNIYRITSHQLRHNAITDRIYEGFTLLEIKDLTHHKTTAMISRSYVHPDKDRLVEKAKQINNEKLDDQTFKGRIINDNIKAFEKINRMLRSHAIGRLGFCSDISGCKSGMYECLDDCDYFEPNLDELVYFEEQVSQWQQKKILFANSKYMLENAQYNYELNQKIVNKIKVMQGVNKL